MNKFIIPSVVVVLILLIGGYFFMSSGNKNDPMTPDSKEAMSKDGDEMVNQEMAKEVEVKGSILDLVKKGIPLSCNFEYVGEDNQTRGVTYVNGDKVRGDFFTSTSEGTMEGHMISDGEYVYTWSSEMPQGVKMKIDEFEKDTDLESNEIATQDGQAEALKGDYDYKCLPWSPDSNVFEVPTDIQFTNISEMMNSVKQNIPNTNNLCTSCERLQDAASIVECKKALNCN